jgi:hypothetical protein
MNAKDAALLQEKRGGGFGEEPEANFSLRHLLGSQ